MLDETCEEHGGAGGDHEVFLEIDGERKWGAFESFMNNRGCIEI